jgi:glucokinase
VKAKTVVALDIGGTFVKAGVVHEGDLLEHTIHEYPSFADRPTEEVLNHFTAIIIDQAKRSGILTRGSDSASKQPFCVGFAFPGPFDYKRGISYIRGLNKYESLYGVPVREQLLERLRRSELANKVGPISMMFENDARLFGLGISTLYPNEKLIALTIGTGFGSVFIDRGTMVTQGQEIPPEGYLYGQPFGESNADDTFSRRGILAAASKASMNIDGIDVKDIAHNARNGNDAAIDVFEQFGSNLAHFLQPFAVRFQPDRIVLGGQIAKSYDLFRDGLEHGLAPVCPSVQEMDNALHHTFLGINQLFARS